MGVRGEVVIIMSFPIADLKGEEVGMTPFAAPVGMTVVAEGGGVVVVKVQVVVPVVVTTESTKISAILN